MKCLTVSDILGTLKRRIGMKYIQKHKIKINIDPLNCELHYDFANMANNFGLYNIAYAELKCAEYLGHDLNEIKLLKNNIINKLSDHAELDVNQYQRFKILQTHLIKLLDPGESILDIGGGHGILSQFMPDNLYFVVEPSVNGISGIRLPFPDNSFDAVVTCHVLEHVTKQNRPQFIDELIRVSKKYTILFNPFKNDLLNDEERAKLVLDITQADWAREHIECGLPFLNEITEYLSLKKLHYEVNKYGDNYTSLATVFMMTFAGRKNRTNLLRINRHLNMTYDHMGSTKYPTNIMIVVTK